jgi:heat shock protein HspQ
VAYFTVLSWTPWTQETEEKCENLNHNNRPSITNEIEIYRILKESDNHSTATRVAEKIQNYQPNGKRFKHPLERLQNGVTFRATAGHLE